MDSVSMIARLADLRVEATLSLASHVHSSPSVSSGSIQRLLGLMASAGALVPMGLLYARLLQRWYAHRHLHPVRDQGLMLRVPPHILPTLRHWTCRSYLMAGVPMGAQSDHVTVFTDASPLGWGGGPEWSPCGRGMAPTRDTSQQRQRADGCAAGVTALPASSQRASCSDSVRQRGHLCLHQQGGGGLVPLISSVWPRRFSTGPSYTCVQSGLRISGGS